MHVETFPSALQSLLRNTSWQPDTLGLSSATTFRIDGPTPFYLKSSPVEPCNGLAAEAGALVWLRPHLPAPEVVHYERADGTDYLLTGALPGLPASADEWKANPKRLVDVLAQSMRALHSLDPLTCPFDQRIDVKLGQVTRTVQLGLVDATDFDPENQLQTPEQILEQLHAQRPPADNAVVTHGDFCLSNLILDNWRLSGFIDLGALGVGDRYQDLALCLRDLTAQLGTDQYDGYFLAAYGLPTADREKLRYFRLLDELN